MILTWIALRSFRLCAMAALIATLIACGGDSPDADPTAALAAADEERVTQEAVRSEKSRDDTPTHTQSDTHTPTRGTKGLGEEGADVALVQPQSGTGTVSNQASSQDESPSDGPTKRRSRLRDELATIAEQEVSEEEALWRLRWREGLTQVEEKLQHDYPDDYSSAGDVQGRYVVVRFRTGVPSGAQALLEEFSKSHNVAVRIEVDDGFSTVDMEGAIRRVHYALYCNQYVEDALTDSEEGVIRSRVLTSVESPNSIVEFERLAQEVLRYGPHRGLSVVVLEWPRGEASTDPAERERHCDEYIESRSLRELAEEDTRFYAMQEGVEYEDVFYLSGWHDDLRGVVDRISRSHPHTDVRLMRYGKGRSAQVGFVADVPPDAQTILRDFGRAYGIQIDIQDNLGFDEE